MRMKSWLVSLLLIAVSGLVYAQKPKTVIDDTTVHLQDKAAFIVTSDKPVFIIKLKSNPTTGYSWFLREWNNGLLEPVKHQYEPVTDQKVVGAPGYEVWTFRAKPSAFVVPLQTTVRFVYTRPWESSENTTQLVFKIITARL